MKKNFIVISGPSGAGKSTLVNYALQNNKNLQLSVSCTTRSPRQNEIDGKDYYFISHDKFQQLIKQNEFLEYTFCFGNYYGTLKSEINRILNTRNICLLDVDCNGVKNIFENYKDSLSILILPPSFNELQNRLQGRKTETSQAIEQRLLSYETALQEKNIYDYVIVNNNLELAQKEFIAIINSACL